MGALVYAANYKSFVAADRVTDPQHLRQLRAPCAAWIIHIVRNLLRAVLGDCELNGAGGPGHPTGANAIVQSQPE